MASTRFINRLVKRSFVIITILLIIFNEVVIYYISERTWKPIGCHNGDNQESNCTRILLIGDPQLLGKTYDTSFYSLIAQYDADRYLRKTFEHSLTFTQPHIICFLGDLLDEGSIASTHDYDNYVQRFKNIYRTDRRIQKIHVPGDNDIGGENGEYISNSNVNRFETEFASKDLFDYGHRLRFFKINRMQLDFTNPDQMNNGQRLRVGISHAPILISGGSLLRAIIADIDPHIIFSAHWHESRIFQYPSTKVIDFYDTGVRQFDLAALKRKHSYLEIMVPTTSYRMGKMKIGMGYAVLENHNLKYTVLWSPNRFMCLLAYMLWSLFALSMLIVFKMMTRCPFRVTARQQQPHYNQVSSIP